MAMIIGVRFKDVGKVYYFDPGEETLLQGDRVIVETSRGIECGEVVIPNREEAEESINHPLKQMIRKATDADLHKLEENARKEREAFGICQEKIRKHGLEMKLIDVEYTFDGSKIIFCFTADGRVDFRELVKDLASIFRTRIELRQIGVRDEAKMLGGLGICGKPFCCATFLGEFQPVSIKMAKEQGLSLSPTKISGSCGRLMCCLKYEQDAYEDLLKITPKNGSIVETAEGIGTVIDLNILTGILKVRLDDTPDAPISIHRSEVSVLQAGKGRRIKRTEPGRPGQTSASTHKSAERAEATVETEVEIHPVEAPSDWAEPSDSPEEGKAAPRPPRDRRKPSSTPSAEGSLPTDEKPSNGDPKPRKPRSRGGRGRRSRSKGTTPAAESPEA